MPKLTDFDLYWSEQVIKEYAVAGLGSNAAQEALKELGMGRRRQTVQEIYREYAGTEKQGNILKNIRKNYTIDPKHYVEPVTTRSGNVPFMRRRYRYNVEFTTYNPATRETFTSGTWYASDSPMTPGQIEDQAMNTLQGAIEKYDLTLQSFNLVEAQHRKGDPWE